MNKRVLSLLVVMALAGLSPVALAQTDLSKIVGVWEGTLDTGGGKLRLVVEFAKAADGTLKGDLDSPDQGSMDLALNAITFEADRLRFELKMVGGVFEGTLNKEATEITGKWQQGGSLPLVLKRVAKDATPRPAPVVTRPQEPVKPYPYNEEDVTYENRAGGVKLAGTLTWPRTTKPVPAVVLITGSGPQDRNEALLGHKPFLVLADHLTRRGIAVLRVDDRGVGGSTGNVNNSTTDDFAGDVLAGVEYLKTRKEINPKQIGLIGHSEGGVVAPIAASRSTDIAFIVLMAGTGLPGEEILYLQGALIAKANGATDAAVESNRRIQQIMFRALKEEKDDAAVRQRIKDDFAKMVANSSNGQTSASLGTDAAIDAQMKRVLTTWFRYFLTYDPRPALTKVKVPVLAINGELDLQVPADANLAAIEKALKAGGNKDHTMIKLPRLNHLFQTSQTGSPAEYARIDETIAPVALQTISDWILKQTK